MFQQSKIRTLVLLASVSFAAGLLSTSANAAVDAQKSSLTVTFKQMNVPVDAKFKTMNANVHFDPANLAASKAQIDVDVASFDLGSAEYNHEVTGKDWFDAKGFPRATFVSSSIKPGANGTYSVTGTLTIRGKTRTVVVPLQFHKDGAGQVFDGSLTFKRLDFGIGQGEWSDTSIVANDVTLKFHVVNKD
ncbi:YceI family protein [Massilia phyllosphaerae]|uniref:YceI family protein n=1 Tax=Massilia phyllosphaerae TaxID=3106034 RepID=UPI002B1CCAED|nr:YceI family protein [Massilia sp. SGZ-792]